MLILHLPALPFLPPPPPQVHAVHRCEPPVLDHAAMLGLGLRHIVDFVVRHLEDSRVGWGLAHLLLPGWGGLACTRCQGALPLAPGWASRPTAAQPATHAMSAPPIPVSSPPLRHPCRL